MNIIKSSFIHLLFFLFFGFYSCKNFSSTAIIGKPGTGKSLSAQLIYKSTRGKYSNNKFFQEFPRIIQIYFIISESTQPEDLIKLFRKQNQNRKPL